MHLKTQNVSTVREVAIFDNTITSVEVLSQMTAIYRTRKLLLILLSVMFSFSLIYLMFVSLTCVIPSYFWLCQYYNHNYEVVWALVSLIYDTLWLLTTYRYYAQGLSFFAWFSTIFLLIFGIILIMALLTILQTAVYFHLIATDFLLASISSICICIATWILQVIIIFYSFRLSKLISQMNKTSYC